eukprot:gnl/MRDRNA2_/MRDRNA2_300163_c0_seq1.p1 gnl/MRDRNA2_/MRDRNA2_300163_c0~~gnl/MRDRNA2_/MRDRNA2_300163_c0_seq1.p1  ORF type:complete len:101 (-),score=10.76 gnl/MRDRNA2_/MRDRNA2_300163_c0_seq1:229-531(-)
MKVFKQVVSTSRKPDHEESKSKRAASHYLPLASALSATLSVVQFSQTRFDHIRSNTASSLSHVPLQAPTDAPKVIKVGKIFCKHMFSTKLSAAIQCAPFA